MGAVSLIVLFLIAITRLITYFSSNSGYDRYDSTPLPPKKRSYEETQIIPGNAFYTNALEHWGTITDEFLASNKDFISNYDEKTGDYVELRRSWMVNSLVLMGVVNNAFNEITGSKVHASYGDALNDSDYQYATSCCIEKLFEKGIFSITGIAIDNYNRYAVILCELPTPMNFIDDLRRCFLEDGYTDLIYYAVNDPNEVTVPMPLKFENFNKTCFRFEQAKQGRDSWKYDNYAMWWAGEKEPTFNSAVIKDDIRLHLDLLNFHNSYALGILSFAFGLTANNNRLRLPDYDEVIISGPEGVEIIITLSTQNGINFHFPMLPRFENYRNKFIKVYVRFCYEIRAQILEHDLPEDDLQKSSTLDWYEHLLNSSETENVASIGCLRKHTH